MDNVCKVTECIEFTSICRQFISDMVETNMSSSMTLSCILSGLAEKLGPLKSQCGLRLPQQARLIVDFTH